MTIRYVQTNDNKYVQFRLMSDTFNTTVANWQGVDDVPTAGSNNLVKSGSVYNIQKDLEHTNNAINRLKIVLPNGSEKSLIPTTTTIISGGGYKAYDYKVEGINNIIKIYSNICTPDPKQYQTAVLWALYDTTVINIAQPIAYGPLLSTGEQHSECDLSLYPNKKILRVTFYTYPEHESTPATKVSYYTTDFVTHDEVNDVLRTTDVINSLDSELTNKPLSAKQGKELNNKLITQETLSPIGSVKSTIPTNTGVRVNGGGYGSLLYDATGKSYLTYTTNATNPQGQYATAVVWALYSSDTTFNETTVVAVGNLLSEDIFSGNIDLSLYPTATTLLVTCIKATAVVTVTNSVEKYATKQEVTEGLHELDERVDELEADSQVVSVVMPNRIHAVKGDRIQVFYRGAIECLNPNIYNVKALCNVGKTYPRYFHYEASSANVGTSKNLQLIVEGSNGVVKAQGTVPIMTINTPSSPASNKNVLVFGASVFGSGSITNELRRRLTETSGTTGDRSNPKGLGLSNITFVGRKRGSAYDVPQEATGGWGWSEYATQGRLAYRFTVSGVVQLHPGDVYSDGSHSYTIAEINVTDGSGNVRCLGSSAPTSTSGTLSLSNGSGDATITYSAYTAESYSPFYNSETHQIDFINYANTYCNGSIDIMVTLCGTNDIFGGNIENVATTYNSYIKPFIRKYHEQFPNGKFIISTLYLPDMNGGLGASYGAGQTANWWKQAQNNYEFARLAYELEVDSEFSSYVTVANVMHLFDTENLYIYANTPVTNRLPDVKERLGQNGVHPSGSGGSFVLGDSEAGTKTIADILYYAVCANL